MRCRWPRRASGRWGEGIRGPGAAAAGLLAAHCGDVEDVLVADERAALERFESIAIGAHEDEVRAKLGPPTCLVTWESPDAKHLWAHCADAAEPRLLSRDRRRDWPWPLTWALPDELTTRRVLVYADGTVFAHYCVDDDGRVVSAQVSIR